MHTFAETRANVAALKAFFTKQGFQYFLSSPDKAREVQDLLLNSGLYFANQLQIIGFAISVKPQEPVIKIAFAKLAAGGTVAVVLTGGVVRAVYLLFSEELRRLVAGKGLLGRAMPRFDRLSKLLKGIAAETL